MDVTLTGQQETRPGSSNVDGEPEKCHLDLHELLHIHMYTYTRAHMCTHMHSQCKSKSGKASVLSFLDISIVAPPLRVGTRGLAGEFQAS